MRQRSPALLAYYLLAAFNLRPLSLSLDVLTT